MKIKKVLYQFGWNSPIRNSDPGGKCPGCWRAMQLAKLKAAQQNGGNTFSPLSSFIYQGKASIQANNARTDYNTKAAQLDPGDKAGRAQLKVEARNNTPEPFKSAIEQGRPIAGEKAKVNDPNFKGNATKTNAEVNEVAKTTGTIGKVFIGATAVQSTYTIATSDNPVRETATEAAGWVGAMYVGGQFATAGSATGGPVGGVLGGVVGSGIGFMGGKKAGDAAIEAASTPPSFLAIPYYF